LTATPALAQHQARLSEDVADHLNAGSQSIDVIVHGDAASVAALARRYNIRIKKSLKEGAVLNVNAGQLDALRRDETQDHISGDMKIRSSADVTTEAIGADQVWRGSDEVGPLSGEGVSVAVIDSGIDTRHSAFLRNRVIFTRDFTGGDGVDRFGHGTHVAGIIAGQRGRTADTREYRGVAPGAYLLNLRVLGDDGSGMASDVIDAIDWSIDHRREYRIRVINLSIGAPVMQPYRDDPLCEAVEKAVRAGITVVVSAGNLGRTVDGKSVYGAITTPANSPYALTVGAIDTHGTPQRSDDTLAAYSSKGPTRFDLVLKPDVAAPGSHIVSAEAPDGYLSQTYPERHVAGAGAGAYMQLSGTSMSAGVVSGAVALLLEQRPALRPADTKAVLQLTSSFLSSAGLVGAGAGEVNVLAATDFIRNGRLGLTAIAAERVTPARFAYAELDHFFVTPFPRLLSNVLAVGTTWRRGIGGQSIVWGAAAVQVGQTSTQSIVWGASYDAQSIVWGAVHQQSIVWGAWTEEYSIVWGASINAQSIVWGASADEHSIVWGAAAEDLSIVWGASSDEQSIVWGAEVGDLD
jgi:serine protease AprX